MSFSLSQSVLDKEVGELLAGVTLIDDLYARRVRRLLAMVSMIERAASGLSAVIPRSARVSTSKRLLLRRHDALEVREACAGKRLGDRNHRGQGR